MKDLSMWIGKRLSTLLFVLTLCISIAMVVPVHASPIVEDVLVNDTSIYLVTGNTWHFYQGYNFSIKSVNQEADSVWLELSQGNTMLKSQILGEGDTFTYEKNGRTILNITVNIIYAGDGEELVAFSPVFQYIDGDLPEPVIPEDESDEGQNNNIDDTLSTGTNGIEGFSLHMTLPVIVGIAALMLMIRKKDN
jgi:hypothetical protein